MKTDEASTCRGMWCASEMKRQRNEHDEVTVTLRTLDMFCKQLQLHLSHNMDEVTVTLVVKACPGLSRGPQTRMPNSLSQLIEARSVFDEMANEDLVSWNAILSGYSQEGNYGLEAIFVFIEMVGEGMGLDHISFGSAV
ncbi:pentatricopeptide repeat-containing protein [Prunus yedoensis var. nudiflora]|uniref:Pentatricopeptide repeat-containing protein n=1 Tax=Prunus yedoensis var. nudiflora TaxID=2094558 RepID=A0A314UE13_PRUYE|nr:pentatricopeptide repeat-containing protein [Prunus yedoensis var. nudiflora]